MWRAPETSLAEDDVEVLHGKADRRPFLAIDLVACRRDNITADAAGRIVIFQLDLPELLHEVAALGGAACGWGDPELIGFHSSGQVEVRLRVEGLRDRRRDRSCSLTWSTAAAPISNRAWRWLRCGICVCVGDPELIGCTHLARLKSGCMWSGCARIGGVTGAAFSPGRRPRRRSASSVEVAALRELRMREEIRSRSAALTWPG